MLGLYRGANAGAEDYPMPARRASIALAVQATPSSRASSCCNSRARWRKRGSPARARMLAARASALRLLNRCVAGLTPSCYSVRPQAGWSAKNATTTVDGMPWCSVVAVVPAPPW